MTVVHPAVPALDRNVIRPYLGDGGAGTRQVNRVYGNSSTSAGEN